MLGIIQDFFAPRPSPIGIDFGTDALRLSQVRFDGDDFRLIATATAPVPVDIRHDISRRMNFFTQTVTDLLAQGKFEGRRVVLGLPSAWTKVHNFRAAAPSEDAVKRGLPGDWANDVEPLQLRHIVAGEIKREVESEWEMIVMGARKASVDALLAAAGRGKLDVRGLTVEMAAMVDCFAHVYRRKADANSTTCYLDIGSQGSRVVIARGGRIVFMRNSACGGAELNAAVAKELAIHPDDARLLRQKLSHAETDRPVRGSSDENNSNTETAAESMRIGPGDDVMNRVESAVEAPLRKIIQEVRQCRSDHDLNFPGAPVDRVVLCGGEARNGAVTRFLSAEMGVATQIGDPMVRLSKSTHVEAGIDRRQAQPMWAISLGLTMGPGKKVAALPVSKKPIIPFAGPRREAA